MHKTTAFTNCPNGLIFCMGPPYFIDFGQLFFCA
nr:MAG TPA: Neurohypophysial hormone [Caudoviricetes sp.]